MPLYNNTSAPHPLILRIVSVLAFCRVSTVLGSSSSSRRSAHSQLPLQDPYGAKNYLLLDNNNNNINIDNAALLDASELLLSEDPICTDVHSHRYDPLACWLWKLKVNVPDQEVKKDLVKVNIHNLVCSNFTVASIDSAYGPSSYSSHDEAVEYLHITNKTQARAKGKNPTIHLSVTGISAACSGEYKVSPGYVAGKIFTRASTDHPEQPAIDLTWEIEATHYPPEDNNNNTTKRYLIPKSLTTSECQSNLAVKNLKFTGSISAKLIGLFKGLIESTVTSQLNDILCPTLQQAVEPLATKAIASLDKLLTKYLPRNENDNSSTPIARIEAATINSVGSQNIFSSSVQSTATALVDFQKDTPLLVNGLNHLNHFLECFYGPGADTNADKSCQHTITKGLKALVSLLMNSDLASEVHIPTPDALHNIRFEIPKYGKVWLDIQDICITGLDQLDNLILLSSLMDENENPKVPSFHTNIVSASGLNVTAGVNITVHPIPGGMIQGDTLHEYFDVHLNTSSLNAMANMSLALNREQFQSIPMGIVLDALPGLFHRESTQNTTVEKECLLDAVHHFNLSGMLLHTIIESTTLVPRFNSRQLRDGYKQSSLLTKKLEEDLDALVNNALQLVLVEYQPLLTDAVSGLVETPLTNLINGLIDKHIPSQIPLGFKQSTDYSFMDSRWAIGPEAETAQCSSGDENIDKDHHELFNFSQLSLLGKLNDYINTPSSLGSLNKAIDQWAENINENHNPSLWQSMIRFVSGVPFVELPGIAFTLLDLHLGNFGSIEHIDLLSPATDEVHLKSGLSFGVNKSSTEAPTFHASFEVGFRPRNISAIINATVSLADLCVAGDSLLQFDVTQLRKLTLSHIMSRGHCGLVPFQHRFVNSHNESRIGKLFATVSASVAGDANFENFTFSADTTEYPLAASLVASILEWVRGTLIDSLNSATRSSTEQADSYCTAGHKFGFDDDPPVLSDDEFADQWLFPIMSLIFAVVMAAQVMFYIIQSWPGTHNSNVESTDSVSEVLSEPLLPLNSEERDADLEPEGKHDEVLVHSTALSAFSRHTVVVLIVGTIVLLMSSNLSSGATVDLFVSWNESETFSLPSLFTFSLANTAQDMWDAKIYPLFFLVVIMSGIWPYMKLLLMLGSWVSPTSLLDPEKRESVLLMLDSLGKFALVDTYLFVLFMVAFRYHAEISESIAVDVFVTPETGFYSFLVATCFSLLMGHFMIYSHRASAMRLLSPRRDAAHFGLRESILGHKFRIRDTVSGEERKMHFSLLFKLVLLLMTVVAVGLLAVGVTRKSFKFEIGGLAGDLLGNERINYYSLLSLGSSLRGSVRDSGSLGVLLLEVTYYFYAVATPFACLFLLLVLQICPMTLRMQRFALTLAEIANAWSAVEVFVISIIASLVEISTFASFIIGHKCDLINTILKEYFDSALDNASDATCFTVTSSVEDSAAFLVLGVMVNSFIVSALLRFIHCSVAERTKEEMMSRVDQSVDDALRNETVSRTVANQLASYGCLRRFIFGFTTSDSTGTVDYAGAPAHPYVPQSTDTYSIDNVNWDDTTQQHENTPQKSSAEDVVDFRREQGPDMTSDRGVFETMRNAFEE